MLSAPRESVPPVRSALVVEDDAALEAEALAAVAVFPDAEVHVARSVADAERLLRRRSFALAVVDLGLPDGSGISLIQRLAESGTVCVARTVFADDEHLFAALGAGALGYLLKGEPLDVLRARLVAAARGEPVLSPAIARRVLARFRAAPSAARPAVEFTAREMDVLRQAASGLTVREIAEALDVSVNTVKTHVRGAYAKLGVRTRVEAVEAARRLGVAGLPHPNG